MTEEEHRAADRKLQAEILGEMEKDWRSYDLLRRYPSSRLVGGRESCQDLAEGDSLMQLGDVRISPMAVVELQYLYEIGES